MPASPRKPRTIATLASAQQAAEKGAFAADQQLFQHTKAEFGTTSIVRLLPDADLDNDLLYVEQRTIELPFLGAIGGEQETEELVAVRVPCLETWGLACAITAFLKPFWKQHKDFCRIYYRSSTFWYSCFVVQTPIIEPNPPVNPIRKLRFTKGLHDRINWCLSPQNAEFSIDPTDENEGRDLRLVKTKKGEFPDWSNTGFSAKARAWNDAERAANDEYGLLNLADLVPPVPEKAIRPLIFQAFQDSTNLLPYDQDRFPWKAWPSTFAKQPQPVPGTTQVQVPAAAPVGPEDFAKAKATASATMDQLRSRTRATRSADEDVLETVEAAD
jgi:hypothetical protein